MRAGPEWQSQLHLPHTLSLNLTYWSEAPNWCSTHVFFILPVDLSFLNV